MLNEHDSFDQLSITNFIENQPIENLSPDQDLHGDQVTGFNFEEAMERNQESADRPLAMGRTLRRQAKGEM